MIYKVRGWVNEAGEKGTGASEILRQVTRQQVLLRLRGRVAHKTQAIEGD